MLKKQKICMFLVLIFFHMTSFAGYTGGQCSIGVDCSRDGGGSCRDPEDRRDRDGDCSNNSGGACQSADNKCTSKDKCDPGDRCDRASSSNYTGGQCTVDLYPLNCSQDNPNCNPDGHPCDRTAQEGISHPLIPSLKERLCGQPRATTAEERISYPKTNLFRELLCGKRGEKCTPKAPD